MPENYRVLAKNFHLISFGQIIVPEDERIDYALVIRDEFLNLKGYVTCREHRADTVYWQYGGSFPGTRESSLTFKIYTMGIEYCLTKYKRITTLIENENIVMLKMAMKAGFRIIGAGGMNGKIFLELMLEKNVQS